MTFIETDYQILTQHLFSNRSVEQAAYLLCRLAKTDEEIRLLVRKVIPVTNEDICEQSAVHMNINQRSFLRAIKAASIAQECFMFVHSHPTGLLDFSSIDDIEEESLFRTAYNRVHSDAVHGSMIFIEPSSFIGRVWLSDGAKISIDLVRTIGRVFRFYFRNQVQDVRMIFFDRQILAFGKDIQLLLGHLRIGIVGIGGTGSAVAEQLIRLGIGSLLIIDNDIFKSSNISRVYGSRAIDESIPKVKLVERLAADIGLGTNVSIIQGRIYYKSVFSRLRECDIVFGCTDDEWGRSILNRMAFYYLIPVFDMGVKIDPKEDGTIKSINGRVTTLIPSASCLFCRGRINSDHIYEESINILNPKEGERLRNDGYVRGLDTDAPAVIPFTTSVASSAIIELLHRLTGCLGEDRDSSEVLHLFDSTRVRTNNRDPLDGCFCSNTSVWGKGDLPLLLDTIWPEE
ncbi:MAG: ThiF family adenylyltransferase [Syntrophales bacterium]|jgi:molybdopterin/thiamine biosynthesis adenylyltransferase